MKDHTRPPECPFCGASRVADILYGLPVEDEDLIRDIEASRVVLGGCCVSEGMPTWRCVECAHEWGSITSGETEHT